MTQPPDRFYDEMCERIEEANDRAVFARWRRICPKLAEADLQELWLVMVKSSNRVEARLLLTRAMDLGLFTEDGGLRDD